jgi:hypothetical protein
MAWHAGCCGGGRDSAVTMSHVAGQTGYVIEQVEGTHSVHMNS